MPTIPSVRLIQTWQKLKVWACLAGMRHTHVTPPFTHGWLYSHLQLIVTSSNMQVWVVIAIWINVQGLWTVAHNEECEKWVIDMLFFTFLHLKSPLEVSLLDLHTSGHIWLLEMKRFWKARRFYSLKELEWSPWDFSLQIVCLSVI